MRTHRTSIAAAVLGLGVLTATGIGVANAQSGSSAASTAVSNAAAVTSAARGCVPDYSPIPASWSTEKGGLDIGRLTKVTAKNGVVTVRIDRVSFFTGAEAKALNHGKVPLDDYILTNIGSTQRTFTVDPKSSILADSSLLTNPDDAGTRHKLTLKQFVANANRPDTKQDQPLVWLRHTNGMSGTVTAIAEQYTP